MFVLNVRQVYSSFINMQINIT